MDKNRLTIISDSTIESNESIKIHFTYNEMLTLKELSEVLDLTNKAINDINREKGIKNNALLGQEYASKVSGIDSGSIVLSIVTNFVAPVALSILASFIYDRLKRLGEKKRKEAQSSAYPISIIVNGNNNMIDIAIDKPYC